MSAFVVDYKTVNSVVDMLSKYETIECKTQLAKRLYELNIESINSLYHLKDNDNAECRKEYADYLENLKNLKYFEQPDRDDVAINYATRCWLYQSCEGDCINSSLYRAVEKIKGIHVLDTAKKLYGSDDTTVDNADDLVDLYRKENSSNYENIWE